MCVCEVKWTNLVERKKHNTTLNSAVQAPKSFEYAWKCGNTENIMVNMSPRQNWLDCVRTYEWWPIPEKQHYFISAMCMFGFFHSLTLFLLAPPTCSPCLHHCSLISIFYHITTDSHSYTNNKNKNRRKTILKLHRTNVTRFETD